MEEISASNRQTQSPNARRTYGSCHDIPKESDVDVAAALKLMLLQVSRKISCVKLSHL